jgi:hypothetical protein
VKEFKLFRDLLRFEVIDVEKDEINIQITARQRTCNREPNARMHGFENRIECALIN